MEVREIYAKALSEYRAKNFDAALKLLEELKKIAPTYKEAYLLEASIWRDRENVVKEFNALNKLLPLFDLSDPAQEDLRFLALYFFAKACRSLDPSKEMVELYVLLSKKIKEREEACFLLNNAVFAAASSENFSADNFQKLYAIYRKHMSDITPYPKKFYAHEKIRIGFLSADFYSHPVMKWAWALVCELDKKFFATYCYSSTENFDAVTEHIKATVDNWRDISELKDAQAAELIRSDEIDILFDMSGHTAGNRLRVAAYHPATVQISGIGFVTSTGLDCFDYFLTDETCAGDESYFTEKLLRLPSSHFCYKPPTVIDISSEPPCLRKGYVTFGCFNQYCKMTNNMLAAWKKILDAVPNSRLILKNSIQNNDDGRNFIVNRLRSVDIDVARVEMRGYTKEYLHEYGDVDIALDTFPYTGGITTCEALFMGVPVISLYGDRMGTRIGLSILKNIGLKELAVNSYDKYINLAVALAGDWELLSILRKNLRGMMTKSPLMDAKNYLREIEAAFVKILRDAKG